MGAKVSNSVVEAARGHGRSRRVDQWLFCMVPDSARAFDTLHTVDRTKSRSAEDERVDVFIQAAGGSTPGL